jgi:multidrug efflux pump subunit AcrA (membrane-fusion protein)
LLSFSIVACHSRTNKNEKHVITVFPKSQVSHIYYSGTIKPIKEDLIISPASGVVSKMNFHYGDFVRKGDLLFTLHSPEMESEFRESISNYFRSKQSYLNAKKSMIGTEMLYKEKIISEQEYSSEQGQYQNVSLSYIEASTKLKQFLIYLPSYQQSLVDMPTLDLEAVKKILQEKVEDLTIYAPSSGIVLFPDEKSTDGAKELQQGSEIKRHDMLLAIGNLSGLSVTANVSESDINHLGRGIPVQLTFDSDLELELKGTVVSVAKQAKASDNVGFSTFPVVIHVLNIPSTHLKKIRVGMNTKLDIMIKELPVIRIPIAAVAQKDEQTWVQVLDSKSGKIREVVVQTGATSQNEVSIVKGIRPGDKVVFYD